MSLIVWLPLNGDSHNQGLKKYTETKNTLSYAINGKVTEKCADKGKLVYNKNPLQMVGTICFWIYPKPTAEKSSIIFGNNPFNDSNRKWTLSMYPNNKSLHSWGCQKEGSNTFNGSFTYENVLKESTWNHVCVAHDLENEYIYVNGNLIGTVPWDSSGTYNFDKETDIIRDESLETGVNNFKINDFRIYDTCLSKAEVKEIAKGKMLHYTFENPYTMETTNIPHTLMKTNSISNSELTLGSDSTGDYIIRNSMTAWLGLTIKEVPVKSGRYYTWSIEVMPIKDIEYVIDGNITCNNSGHEGNDIQHYDVIRGYSHMNHKLDGSDTLPKGKLEAYKWTRIYFTTKVKQDCTNPKLFHTFVPYIPSGDSNVKVYYRNSQLEERMYDSPYILSKRNPLTIKDNSGMGNNGTQVYQRIEIPITPKTQTICSTLTKYGGVTNTYNSTNKTYTLNNFIVTDNAVCLLATMKYNNSYHYVDSIISYEFDMTLKDIAIVSGATPEVRIQGPTIFKDDTFIWDSNPVNAIFFTSRLNNLKNGTYHVYIEKTIENISSNIDYYELGMRFDGIKSGTFTVSNLHVYYQNLDTSKLTIANKSAVGTYSAYFNGKNYIDCGLATPQDIDALTLSCWAYKDDWTTLGNGNPIDSALISSVNSGGFGFKVEPCTAEKLNTAINFVIYYKDKDYLEHIVSKGLCIDYSKLSKGWHLITGTADRNKATLYLDGEKVKEITHNLNKPIYNYDTVIKKRTNLLVGAEPEARTGKLTIVGVYIDDVRLYATALSDKDIKALYNVKTRIDNKSNLLCNQLVETKQENLVSDLSKITDFGQFKCTCNINYDTDNKILTFTATNDSTEPYAGPYILNKYYGGSLVTNETYRYSIYVKFSRSGRWKVGEERIINSSSSPFKNGQEYEAGKWYKIENEGVATAAQVNFIFYSENQIIKAGDKIQIRDFQMYRLYDDENYNPGPNIKGQYKTFELNETFNEDVENSGATIVDKYGAEWLEVFYHDNNNCKVFFDSQTEALHTNSQYKFSILDQLEKFRGNDGKFEFLLEYPTDIPGKYNRWKQTDNPVKVTANNTYASGYEAIHVDWSGNNWGGLLRATSSNVTLLKGSIVNSNTWFFAIGAIKAWDSSINHNGVPGPYTSVSDYSNPNGIVHDIHLYVRIDNLENNDNFKIYNRKTKTNEIIEI